jgi:hypothetical protein
MRRHLLGACAAVPLVLLIAVAGCVSSGGSGSKVASVSGTASPTASASSAANPSARERALKFAQCMRDHGVPMEDPQFDGDKIEVQIGGAGGPMDKSKVDAAHEACKEWSPIGGPGGAKPDPQMLENMRKQAQCMRDNGVEGFPDPSTDGGIQIDGSIAHDPDFDAAQEKCMKDMPKPGPMKSANPR